MINIIEQFDPNRRTENRIYGVFPVLVSCVTPTGTRIKVRTVADNISQNGIFFQLPQTISCGTNLFSIISVSKDVTVAARGQIVRIENEDDILKGCGVCFQQIKLVHTAV